MKSAIWLSALAVASASCSSGPADDAAPGGTGKTTRALGAVTLKWTVPSEERFLDLMGRSDGSALVTTRSDVVAISASGATSLVFRGSEAHGRPRLAQGSEGFLVARGDALEVHDAAGVEKAEIALGRNEYGRLIPGGLRTFLPRVESPDPELGRVLDGRVFSEAGQLDASFPAEDLFISRPTESHVLWATRTALTKTTVEGDPVWSIDVPVHDLETDAGARISIVNRAGDTRVVELFREDERLGAATFESPIWNLAVAPAGEFAAASSRALARLFVDGRTIAAVQFGPDVVPISLDVSDAGHLAVGTQDHRARTAAVSIYDATGALGWTRTLAHDTRGYRPAVRFSPDGKGLFVLESTAISFFALEAP